MMKLKIRLFFLLILACMLTILPLPQAIAGFKPPWVLLLILYIQFYLPQYFNPSILLFLGVCLDVLLSTALGEHAFAFILTTWFAAGKVRRFNFFSISQQMMLVGLFCLFYQGIIFLMGAFMGHSNEFFMVVGSAFLGLLFWPFMRLLGESTLCYDPRL